MASTAENSGKTAQWLKAIASPAVLFYTLPWLMVILTAGTIAQKDLGLFETQARFFSSWILWLGPVPLPGMYPVLTVITVSLLAKFLLYSPWRLEKAGTILTHLGVLVLLIGGLLTAMTQKEGFILLGEGQQGNAVSDYHDRVFSIDKDGVLLRAVPFDDLAQLKEIKDLPFELRIESTCRNCKPEPVESSENRHGLAERVSLQNAPAEKEDEANLSGVNFSVAGVDADQSGHYLVMEEIPHTPQIDAGDAIYSFHIGRAQTILPFTLTLKDFKRSMHPGTDMAKAFSSEVTIEDGGVNWDYRIEMNQPLRYKGYTFYQSSFSIRPDGEHSILSVVRNEGRAFPYMASALIFLGLAVHLILHVRTRQREHS
ncbi:MAG: hypothetical protein DI551_01965 [Micavibrio aeruginosavorus]|uniref:ResB-like domain-containing protein n=1 Tax=Micavibrio aeruginosavorus TaxID=349221 RepID=A0A2W5N6U5_9BACT|nr:MAG: hypothetical protein DI551_01965 [Micavibrio aeruginosavorus]